MSPIISFVYEIILDKSMFGRTLFEVDGNQSLEKKTTGQKLMDNNSGVGFGLDCDDKKMINLTFLMVP